MVNKPAEIAVFLGENGNTAKFYGEGKIVIFSQDDGNWKINREKEFFLKENQGIIDFRQTMEEILKFLSRCRIFVGLSITSIPYYFLEKAKFSLWEYDGNPSEFLDYVLLQEQLTQQHGKKASKKDSGEDEPADAGLLETPSGNYSILINGIQEKSAVSASKQVLLPFLRRGGYESLEITCSQIPGWLEEEVLRRRLSLHIEENGRNKVKIILKK